MFDLYGTLVYGWGASEAASKAAEVAELLGVPPEPFARHLADTRDARMRGQLGGTLQSLSSVCSRFGEAPEEARLAAAAALRDRQFREVLETPRPETEAVLLELRRRGLRVGLISDCSSETAAVWEEVGWTGLIEVALLSWRAGLRKPAPELYEEMSRQLGIPPGRLLYVGDGGSGELSGAAGAGMTPLRITIQAPAGDQPLQYDSDIAWDGPSVSSLDQIWSWLGGAPGEPA